VQFSQIPVPIPLAFASGAGAPYIRPVPVPSQQGVQNGAASYTDGFPPSTFIALAAGGAGPWGADVNGLLNQITAGLQWLQLGGAQPFSASFAASVGGYPQFSLVMADSGNNLWLSTVDNNSADPDIAGPGAWQPVSLVHGFVVFSGNGSWLVPSGVYLVRARMWGGGGGGGGATVGLAGLGGAGGGYGEGNFNVTPGASMPVTIANGGAPGSIGNNGGAGGFSAFSSATAFGGAGGLGSNGSQATVPSLPGGSSGFVLGVNGVSGGSYFPLPGGNVSASGGGTWGTSNSLLTYNDPGNPGVFPGGGGCGGSCSSPSAGNAGGAGAGGLLLLDW
jgi:hypothetical protein